MAHRLYYTRQRRPFQDMVTIPALGYRCRTCLPLQEVFTISGHGYYYGTWLLCFSYIFGLSLLIQGEVGQVTSYGILRHY